MPAGAEDPEMRLDHAPALQHDFCVLFDEGTLDTRMKDYEAQSLHDDVRRSCARTRVYAGGGSSGARGLPVPR
jgi:hypothetical protein